MRFYTKEWSRLLDSLGTVDMFEPVIDKEYTDDEIAELYQDFMEKHVQEERSSYDEPPLFIYEDEEAFDPDEFDPEDYLVGDVDENGEEHNLHHPEDIEELVRFERRMHILALEEYENREPFDEDEARSEFEENYRDFLEEPDEDIPQWVLDTVGRRLLAMGAMPEGAYKRLRAEEEEMQERFDELDAAADEALEDMYGEMPDEYQGLLEDFDELDGDYVISFAIEDGDAELELAGWDEDGEPVIRTAVFEGAEIIEDECAEIEASVDEDGDFTSSCDLEYHEIYFEDDRFEVHLLLNDGEPKYLTLSCDEISISQRSAE